MRNTQLTGTLKQLTQDSFVLTTRILVSGSLIAYVTFLSTGRDSRVILLFQVRWKFMLCLSLMLLIFISLTPNYLLSYLLSILRNPDSFLSLLFDSLKLLVGLVLLYGVARGIYLFFLQKSYGLPFIQRKKEAPSEYGLRIPIKPFPST